MPSYDHLGIYDEVLSHNCRAGLEAKFLCKALPSWGGFINLGKWEQGQKPGLQLRATGPLTVPSDSGMAWPASERWGREVTPT